MICFCHTEDFPSAAPKTEQKSLFHTAQRSYTIERYRKGRDFPIIYCLSSYIYLLAIFKRHIAICSVHHSNINTKVEVKIVFKDISQKHCMFFIILNFDIHGYWIVCHLCQVHLHIKQARSFNLICF